MSLIPEMIQSKHLVSWSIKNFDFRLRDNRPMHSERFELRTLDVTTFNFTLYAQGKTQSDYMQLVLTLQYNGSRDPSALYITSVRFDVCLLDESNAAFFTTRGSYRPSFSSPSTMPVSIIPLNQFNVEQHLQVESTLVLSCQLTTTTNQRKLLASIYNDEIISLGSCLIGMLETSSRSDMVVHSKDGAILNVHLCIVRARCPILFGHKPPDEVDLAQQPKPVWYSKASTKALRTLLYYLYGRIVIEVPSSSLKAELMTLAGRYELSDLERKLTDYPIEKDLKTEVIVEEIAFKHPLSDSMWEGGFEFQHRFRFLPSKNLIVPDLMVSWEIKTQTTGEKYLGTSFEFSSTEMENAMMYCKFSLLGATGVVLRSKDYWHWFVGDEWTPSPPFYAEEDRWMRPRCIKCEVRISEMCYEHHTPTVRCIPELGTLILFNDVSLIGEDLRKLYEYGIHCDLKMEVGDREFLGHSSFLANRSLMIREKLKTSMEETAGMASIRLEGIDPDVFEKVLHYMYFGKTNISDKETAKALSDAASYFQLSNLLEKCASFTTD